MWSLSRAVSTNVEKSVIKQRLGAKRREGWTQADTKQNNGVEKLV